MRSGTILDRQTRHADAAVGELLVLWQHPVTREFHVIGRLSNDADRFTFVYTRAAADIANFRPLLGMDDLQQSYTSTSLPAVFGQRVMARERPDYATYIRALGLDPEVATPWEQIVRSGGTRHGDTLQFMAVPRLSSGRAQACFLVNGISHIVEALPRFAQNSAPHVTPEQHESAMRSLQPGDTVQLRAEIGNPVDPTAVLVMRGTAPLGWVPRILSPSVKELLEAGPVSAVVDRVAPPSSPPHTRIVLDLDVAAPMGFEFDRAQRWVALSSL